MADNLIPFVFDFQTKGLAAIKEATGSAESLRAAFTASPKFTVEANMTGNAEQKTRALASAEEQYQRILAKRIATTVTAAGQFGQVRGELIEAINSYADLPKEGRKVQLLRESGIDDTKTAVALANLQREIFSLKAIASAAGRSENINELSDEAEQRLERYNKYAREPFDPRIYPGELEYQATARIAEKGERYDALLNSLAVRSALTQGLIPGPLNPSEESISRAVTSYYAKTPSGLRLKEGELYNVRSAVDQILLNAPVGGRLAAGNLLGPGGVNIETTGGRIDRGISSEILEAELSGNLAQSVAAKTELTRSSLLSSKTLQAYRSRSKLEQLQELFYNPGATDERIDTFTFVQRLLGTIFQGNEGGFAQLGADESAGSYQDLLKGGLHPRFIEAAQAARIAAEGKGYFSNADIASRLKINPKEAQDLGLALQGIGFAGAPIPGKGREFIQSTNDIATFRIGLRNAADTLVKLEKEAARAAAAEAKLADAQLAADRNRLGKAYSGRQITQAEFDEERARRGLGEGGTLPPPPPPEEPKSLLSDGSGGENLRGAYARYQGGAIATRVRSFSSAFQSLFVYASAATLIYGVASALRSATTAALDFEQNMERLRGLLPNRNDNDLSIIRTGSINIAERYGVALNDVVESIQRFVQSGRTAQQAVSDLDAALRGGTGLGLSAKDSEELLISVRSLTFEYGQARSQIDVDIFDRIAAAQSQAAVSATDLAEAIKNIGPTLEQLKSPFTGLLDNYDLVLAATGEIVQKTGKSGEQVSTSLRNTFSRLARPEVVKAVQQLSGIPLGTVESGGTEQRPIFEILQELSKYYQANKGSENLQRLLVTLSGSRQTSAIVALLQDFADVEKKSETIALAYGDATERTGFVLNSLKTRIEGARNSLQSLGVTILDSTIVGGSLRAVLAGITATFNFLARDTATLVPKLVVLAGGIFVVARAVNLLGTAILYSLGAKSVQTLIGAAAGFGNLGVSVYAAAKALQKTLGGIGLFAGLEAAIGPTGVIALAVAALGALAAAGFAVYEALSKTSALQFKFIKPEDVKNQNVPQLQDFAAVAQKFGETVPDLYQKVVGVSDNAVRALPDNLKGQAGRQAVFDLVYPQLRKDIPGFAKYIDDLTKSLNPAASATLRLSETMKLIGQVAFLQSGIVEANVQQIEKQFFDLEGSIHDAITSAATQPLFPESRNVGRGIAPSVISGIEALEKGFGEKTNPVITAYINAALKTGIDQDRLEKAVHGASSKGQALDIITQLIDSFVHVDPSRAAKFNQEFRTSLATLTGVDKAQNLQSQAGLGGPSLAAGTIGRGIIDRAVQASGAAITAAKIGEFGGDSAKRIDTLFRDLSGGVNETINSLNDLNETFKGPFSDLLKQLYIGQRNIEAAASAAHSLGTVVNGATEKLKLYQEIGTKVAQLPITLLDNYITISSELNRTKAITPAGDEVDAVTHRIVVLKKQQQDAKDALEAFSPNFLQNLGENLKDLTQDLSANNLDASRLTNIKAALDAGTGGITAEDIRIVLIDAINKLINVDLPGVLKEFLPGVIPAANREIGANALQGNLEIARARAQGQYNLTKGDLPSNITLLQQQKALAIFQAEAEYQLSINELMEKGDSITVQAFLTERAGIEIQRQKSLAFAEQNELKEEQLAIDKLIADAQLKAQKQIDENFKARTAGLREVLLDFDKLRKRPLDTVLPPIGKNFAERQVDQLLEFGLPSKNNGIFSRLSKALGAGGEQDPIKNGLITGGTAAALTIQRAMIYAGNVVAHTLGLTTTAPGGAPAGSPGAAAGTSFGKGGGDLFSAFPLVAAAAGTFIKSGGAGAHVTGGAGFSIRGVPVNLPSPQELDLLKKAKAAADAQDTLERNQAIAGLAGTAGILAGSALGFKRNRPTYNQEGAQLGGLAGGILLGNTIFPGFGALVGGILGGIFGGGINKPGTPQQSTLDKVADNTKETVTLLQNTNKLLDKSGLAFNIPSTFNLPRYGVDTYGGATVVGAGRVSNSVSVSVSIGGTNASPSQIGQMVAQAVSDKLDSEYRSSGRYVSRTRY